VAEPVDDPPPAEGVQVVEGRRVRGQVSCAVPGRDQELAHRPRGPDRLSALRRRAPPPHRALQLHRKNLRRDPPPGQGHRPAPRRDQLPHPGLGRARPSSRGWRSLTMTSDGLRLLQDVHRSLLQPDRQLRRPTVTAAHPGGARQFCRLARSFSALGWSGGWCLVVCCGPDPVFGGGWLAGSGAW
jgi:hypothetical protein